MGPIRSGGEGFWMSLGSKLRELRIKKNQSLQDVASAIGVSKAYVWQLERDEDGNPSLDVLKKIADHFATSVAVLAGESTELTADSQLMRMFRNLSELTPGDRAVIEDVMKTLKKNRPPNAN
jgi:transcriptional regulator with XRE-family HTH domain